MWLIRIKRITSFILNSDSSVLCFLSGLLSALYFCARSGTILRGLLLVLQLPALAEPWPGVAAEGPS